jgi:tRNA 2-selenouridine synthase
MARAVDIVEFLNTPGSIFDVRSPCEFLQGRLPEARSLALFSDAERATIGFTYKQIGRKEAVIEGMRYAAPKFELYVNEVESHLACGGTAKIHCFRGGMRSQSMAMLLEMAGIPTVTLAGGYKAYRRYVLASLHKPLQLRLIGGMTGSGKTALLHSLALQGAQTIDLEALANHRGSSFGMLGLNQQPSNEQFENDIAAKLFSVDPDQPIWLEDESRRIGNCKIPDPLYAAMRQAPLFVIERSIGERLSTLCHTYWSYPPAELIAATSRLAKKLGAVRTAEIVAAIESGNLQSATLMLLEYYDKSYRHEMERAMRKQLLIPATAQSNEAVAHQLRAIYHQ